MSSTKRLSAALVACFGLVPSLLAQGEEKAPPKLPPGAAAPAFALVQMVRGEAVTELAADVVHLVEFWGGEAATGFERERDYARFLKEHGKKLHIVAVVGPSEDYDYEVVRDYYAENGAHLKMTIGFDDGGKLHESWVAAAGKEAPTVFLVHQGKVAWADGFGMLPLALPEVMSGKFDPEALAADSAAAMRMVKKLAITAGFAPKKAVNVLDELVAKWPALEPMAVVMAWDSLVTGDEPVHATPLQERVYKALLASEDAWVMNGLAWSIVDPEVEAESRDLDLAMRAAKKAVEWSHEQDPSILDTLARVHFMKKDYKTAVKVQKQAIALVEDESERVGLMQTLKEYERLLAGK